MKINLTNLALIETLNMLNKFNNVTGKLGYAIARTKSKMMAELKPFEDERNKLIEKYGVVGKDGQYSVPQDSENFTDFAREVTAIAEETVEIDFHQVSQEVFDNTDVYSEDCTTRDYELLEVLFVEKQKESGEVADNNG